MDNATEADWAVQLGKARQNISQQKNTPLPRQKKNVEEEILYYKLQLANFLAAPEATREDTRELLQKLFVARAKQTAVAIAETRETYGGAGPATVEVIVKKYIDDCTRLIRAIAG